MPNSYTFFKPEIRQWFIDNVPTSKRILDVGPGQGTYSNLLRDLGYRMDAVEVWAPYIEQFDLRSKYDNVYNANILDFDLTDYDFIILGDVLEHISTENAQNLIDTIVNSMKDCLVAIPYMMEQDGEEYGNVYETHLQADLTHDVMRQRYKVLEAIYKNQYYGYYVNRRFKIKRGYVMYATESYLNTVQAAVDSIRKYSPLPIFVYMVNSDAKVKGAVNIPWPVGINSTEKKAFIDRADSNIYKLLVQRPQIVRDALRYMETVAYIDSDSIATPYIERIFDMFPERSSVPYFVEGIYEWMLANGRGGADSYNDLSTTLEHPACELFGVNQKVRKLYRQTGYFVAGQWCDSFLAEWRWMCMHPDVFKNPQYYAPYHEETIVNVLLWKYNFHEGLPYIYINGGLDRVDKAYGGEAKYIPGIRNNLGYFFRLPDSKQDILFFHGEKDPVKMKEISDRIDFYNRYMIDPKKNWGDIVSKRIISHFTTKKIDPMDIFHFDDKAIVPKKDGKLLAIGSTMVFARKNDYVWGTGVISDREVNMEEHPKKIYAVRGPISRKELIRVGLECPEVYGDPALLFPRIYQPNVSKKYKYGIIPHYFEYQNASVLNTLYRLEEMDVKVINITTGIEQFVDEVNECEYIISSSLHGVIVADAYRIPNVRVRMSNDITGGDFKYMDYFASVKRKYQHKPIWVTEETTLEDIEKFPFELGDISCADDLLPNAPWKDPNCTLFTPTKVLFVAPHLSTGGMPAFLLKRLEALVEYSDFEIHVAEFSCYSSEFVVQRNQIKAMLGDRFHEVGADKMNLLNIIRDNNIDVVHVDEIMEGFDNFNRVPMPVLRALYDTRRTWRIVETCHNVWFNPDKDKLFHPDGYAFCTPYHEITFGNMPSEKKVIQFPIENRVPIYQVKRRAKEQLGFDLNKKHVLNVGLWTPGKNQVEGLEIARQLPDIQFHFVGNQAPNFEDYWGPAMKDLPPNVKIWGERSDTETFMHAADMFMFNSTWECNPLVLREAISYGLPVLARDLPQYVGMFDNYIVKLDDSRKVWQVREILNSVEPIINPTDTNERFSKDHETFYRHLLSLPPIKQNNVSDVKINTHFVGRPTVEVLGESDKTYTVKFIDNNGGILVHQAKIKINQWTAANRAYYTNWKIEVYEENELVYEHLFDLKGKRVYIAFDSASLGDNIAWIPYVLEFKKKHDCHVIVSTFKNFLFKDVYPELEFINPGEQAPNIYAMYKLGWFYNSNLEPAEPHKIPLQKAATNILGLEFNELTPRIKHNLGRNMYGKYVTIATNSTAQCKFWTKEGWQGLINYLVDRGYKVVNVSMENNPFDNCEQLRDKSIENTMNTIHHSEFFIGLSSGLSWLAWGLGKQVVMIANFSDAYHEFTSRCTRIVKEDVCHGCWNTHKFDKADWYWCPLQKGTSREFECHTSITAADVIEKVEFIIENIGKYNLDTHSRCDSCNKNVL
jgi:autotransporter strand-loop-strand O-heptosyltransferase